MSIRKAEELFIIDVDVHMHTPPAQIAPYCDMPWRRALENLTQNFSGIAMKPVLFSPGRPFVRRQDYGYTYGKKGR